MTALYAPRAGRWFQHQAFISLIFLGLLVAICTATDLLSRNKVLEHWLTAESSSLADKDNKVFSDTGNFIDFEDRILLNEIPHANYAKGGVYFFGTSNMKWAFSKWDLPTAERHLIGNYGIGASNHAIQLQLIRYLIAEHGFLSAGKRDLVIFGASFHLGVSVSPEENFFYALLRRHGLFTITSDGRVVPTRMTAIEHWLRVEKARTGGLFWHGERVAKAWLEFIAGRTKPQPHNASQYRQAWRSFMGPDWEKSIDEQIESFKQSILLVRSYGAEVEVILLPQGTWMDSLPFGPYYEAKVRTLCKETSTPLVDFSQSLPDDAFVDSNHLTVRGQEEFRKLIMGQIGGHLATIEATSGNQPK